MKLTLHRNHDVVRMLVRYRTSIFETILSCPGVSLKNQNVIRKKYRNSKLRRNGYRKEEKEEEEETRIEQRKKKRRKEDRIEKVGGGSLKKQEKKSTKKRRRQEIERIN